MYTTQQKVRCVHWYAKFSSTTQVRREFAKEYKVPNRKAPSRKAILEWHRNFAEADNPQHDEKPGVSEDGQVQTVVRNDPSLALRRASQRLKIPKTIRAVLRSRGVSLRIVSGRPRAPTRIIADTEMIDFATVRRETWCIPSLVAELENPEDAIRWLARRHLIRNSVPCERCSKLCTLVAYKQGIDGKRWACKACGFRKSIRDHSFFSQSRLSLKQIVIIVFCWAYDMPHDIAKHEAKVYQDHTIVDWFNFCREECATYLERNSQVVGGIDDSGKPIIVEIDQFKYFPRKYNQGVWIKGHWVFGGIERGTGRCFLVEVPDRRISTMEAVVQRYISPGTHIISDGWPAECNVDKIGDGIYTHSTIAAQNILANLDDCDENPQNVENMWMRARRKLKHQFGTKSPLIPSYLHEFMYRNSLPDKNIFSNFIVCLADNYPL